MDNLSNEIRKLPADPEAEMNRLKELIQEPASMHEAPTVAIEKPNEEDLSKETWEKEWLPRIRVRKFDSVDIMRIRDTVSMNSDSEKISCNLGTMQRMTIVLGIANAPFFSDIVGMDGIDDQMFDKRYKQEFRKIPTELIDRLFYEVNKVNKSQFSRNISKN